MNVNHNLRQKVHELTRSHLTSHADAEGEVRTMYTDPDTGNRKPFQEMSLFAQLRQEQTAGTRNAGTSGSGSRAPVAIQALVLWSEIQESLNTKIIQITGADQPQLSPDAKLQRWAAHTLQDTTGAQQEACLAQLVGWANAITGLLHPVRKTEIKGHCPECHQSHAWTWNEDQWVRNTALVAVGLDASCGACGSQWSGADEVTALASALQEAA